MPRSTSLPHLLHRWATGLLLLALVLAGSANAAGRERLSLDNGWLFHRGDVQIGRAHV